MAELRGSSQSVAGIGKGVRGRSIVRSIVRETVRGMMELLMQTWHGFSKR